jgi:hypothetical protein
MTARQIILTWYVCIALAMVGFTFLSFVVVR